MKAWVQFSRRMGRCAKGTAGCDLHSLYRDIRVGGQGFVQIRVSMSMWGESDL